ncbi:protein of unknown function (plasmid) [Cupriavidus taiwanensis]|uniref:Uncharacterized protein n=1 Tax=Cupriavidus taiwanensis TaxID=164546 RepID=A0A7Z7JCZ7_9BURK|nr:protein of unknown function [Cupriavidus taiwanensis]SOZ10893.1 protein of unknown function [Cupriavidus taiwanensis]SOZ42145.1 protein of unknown function [Cupriavidus taiwanensis]SPC21255.1 protein of unknown function [Cupriavidus taiwanensis]SPD55396.1 protein of unknown function [Cupriavidus taiwanensis]
MGARSALLRNVSRGRCLRSLTFERSQQGVGSLLPALLVGRLRLRCARSLSQVLRTGTECVAALARVIAGEPKGFSRPACFLPSPACGRGAGERAGAATKSSLQQPRRPRPVSAKRAATRFVPQPQNPSFKT